MVKSVVYYSKAVELLFHSSTLTLVLFYPYDRKFWTQRKIVILLDQAYRPQVVMKALKAIYPAIDKKIKLQVSQKMSRAEKGTKD